MRMWLCSNRIFLPSIMVRNFSLLNGSVSVEGAAFSAAKTRMKPLKEKQEKLVKTFEEGGGSRGIAAHTVRNKKLLVRSRLAKLMDNSEFIEIFRFAGYGMPYGTIPAGGCVAAIGKVQDRYCLVFGSDATIKGGTIYPITLKKQLRQQELGADLKLPLIYLIDSGGAFLPLQADIFPDSKHGGRTFYNEAVFGADGINQLSMVCGSCTAGGAYVPTMCEETTMVHGIGHIFLGGPALVKAALGEVVSAEELGGAKLHSSVSGCSDHYAANEDIGLNQIRTMMSTLPEQEEIFINREFPSEPCYSASQMDGLIPNFYDSPNKDLIYQILARILDGSKLFEFKENFGANLLTGFGRLNGRLVGVACSFDRLTMEDGLKGSHFVQLCQQRSAPIIFLVHTVEDGSHGDARQSALTLRAKSNFMSSVATFPFPKITVVIGDSVGWDSVIMCGRSMSPRFLFAWPNARIGMTAENAMDAFAAAGNVFIDDVIKPEETRTWLAKSFELCYIRCKGDSEQFAPKAILRF